MQLLTPSGALDRLGADVAGYEALLAGGDLDAAVPGCPGWSVRELTWHLGRVHRWARAAVTLGGDRPAEPPEGGPADREGLRAWFAEGATALVGTLAATDPATPCWTFGPRPRTAAFWFRRQAQETAVHSWDAQLACGRRAELPLDLAVDGVDEVVGTFVPRQVRLGRMTLPGASVALEATDGGPGAAWRLGPPGDPSPPEATVSAPAAVLLLVLWKRLPVEHPQVAVAGDVAAARAVLSAPLTP